MLKKLQYDFFTANFARYYLAPLLALVIILSVREREIFDAIYSFNTDLYDQFLGWAWLGILFVTVVAVVNYMSRPDDPEAYFRANEKVFSNFLNFFACINLCSLYFICFYLTFLLVDMEQRGGLGFWGLAAAVPLFCWYYYSFAALRYHANSSENT